MNKVFDFAAPRKRNQSKTCNTYYTTVCAYHV